MGGSVAERLIPCPGSWALIEEMKKKGPIEDPLDDEWREEGVKAHELGQLCLVQGFDAWEVQERFPMLEPSAVAAVQVYLDHVRSHWPADGIVGRTDYFIERRVQGEHELQFGTLDYVELNPLTGFCGIDDYKHGVGVVKSARDNPQLLYYADCLLHEFPWIEQFKLTICQPRAPYSEGTIRSWEVDAGKVRHWSETILHPAMERALSPEAPRKIGLHCQFCPAKLRCPEALAAYVDATSPIVEPKDMDDITLAELWAKMPVVAFVRKALDQEMTRRMMSGKKFDVAKLVKQKSDRVWKDGAADIICNRFGAAALTEPKLKSPAQIEELPGASALVKEWAYKPDGGYTVAPIGDRRKAVELPSAAASFKGFVRS